MSILCAMTAEVSVFIFKNLYILLLLYFLLLLLFQSFGSQSFCCVVFPAHKKKHEKAKALFTRFVWFIMLLTIF